MDAVAIRETSSRMVGALTTETQQFVTMMIGGQMFGLPILHVHDIVVPEKVTRVPLSPPEVAGLINLRGKIVTAIDLREMLRMPPIETTTKRVGVTVSHRNETYTLLVDKIGEVVELSVDDFENNPPTFDPRWRYLANGVFRLKQGLLVVLSTERLLAFDQPTR